MSHRALRQLRGTDLSVLRERPFLLLLSARSFSVLGDVVAPIGLAFAVLSMPGGSGTTLGLIFAVRTVSRIPFMLYGAVLADRFPRRLVMLISDLVAGIAQMSIAILILTGTASTLSLAGLSLIGGVAGAFLQPAARAITTDLVPREKLQAANALTQLAMSAGNVGGAAIAGVLVVLVGPGWALALDAFTFFISAALLAGIGRSRYTTRQPSPKETLFAQLKGGWREFRSRRWVWVTVAQLALVNACIGGGHLILGPVVANTELGGASSWATLVTAQAIGLVVGSILAIRVRPRWPIRAAILFVLGIVPAFVCLAWPAPVLVTTAAMVISGVSIALADITFQTALQRKIPPEAISRVMSYDYLGSFVFLPLGMATIAPIANVVGVRTTLLGAATIITLATLIALVGAGVRSVRGEEASPDEPESAIVQESTESGTAAAVR